MKKNAPLLTQLLVVAGFLLAPLVARAQGVPELIYYKFDSPGATTQNFASTPAGTNPAPLTGATIGSTGQFGTALIGNGATTASNSVNTGWAPNLGSGSWTISMWLNNIPSSATLQYFFGDVNTSSLRSFTGGVAGAGGIRLVGGGITAMDMANVIGPGPVVIHYVYDATAGNIRGYVNGVLHSTSTQTSVNFTGAGPFMVGGYPSNNGLPAGGLMDEFRLYNRALTAAEIATTWNVSLPFAPSPNDAGVTSLVAPTSPTTPGNQNVQVTIKNFGTSALTSAQIAWRVGTTAGTTFNWTGNLAPNAQSGPVTIGSFNFPNGSHNLKVWTTSPNGATDGNNHNDTLNATVVACNTISGTFTIDKNSPASATSYQSFATALQALTSCGINGPVVFNVAANSGPYNEQVVMPVIPGTSATNTITFNGNGNTISSTPAGANLGIITLNGADRVKFDNFVITLPASATTGWGVQLMDQADHNTITNSTINLPLTSTSTNVNGIAFGATATTAASNGDNNIFSNNTINGGYYAIRINGGTGTAAAMGNQVVNNTINDCYAYNIYLFNTDGTLVDNNNISRATRTAVTTFYGITLAGTTQNSIISRNRLHNTHGAASSVTGTVYGLYSTSNDAPVGSENIFRNNLIYNVNTNGLIYVIYSVGSDGAHYFHNTIDLSNASNTGTVRGFFQTTLASNVRFQNNIISINSGASGSKHAIYFGTTTSTIASNRNVFHVTGGANVGSLGTANQATIADWRTASSQDANSVAADPQYTDPSTGNFRPTNVAVNDIGMPLPNVTTDITGATRSTTAPDPGAYEFSVNANDVGITDISGAASGCNLTSSQSITVTVKNFGSAPQSNIPVNFLVNGTIIGTGTVPGPLAPNATATHTFTTPANLGAPGPYTIVANTLMTGDADASNNSFTLNVSNSLIPNLPISLDFETPATGTGAVQVVTNTLSTITEATGAGNGTPATKGMIMAGVTSAGWQPPLGVVTPWTSNPGNFSAVYMCINPAAGPALDSLYLIFDLKQLYKGAAANTNFRVTVNGQQIGQTYTPPFAGPSTNWQRIRVDLSQFKTLQNVLIGLESSVKEEYANGTGTANLIDNVIISRRVLGVKSDILAAQINVYPNPSTGIFNVTAPKGKYTVEVTDLTGRTILKQTSNGTATQLNLKDAAKGIYLMKLTSEGNVATKRLVVE